MVGTAVSLHVICFRCHFTIVDGALCGAVAIIVIVVGRCGEVNVAFVREVVSILRSQRAAAPIIAFAGIRMLLRDERTVFVVSFPFLVVLSSPASQVCLEV